MDHQQQGRSTYFDNGGRGRGRHNGGGRRGGGGGGRGGKGGRHGGRDDGGRRADTAAAPPSPAAAATATTSIRQGRANSTDDDVAAALVLVPASASSAVNSSRPDVKVSLTASSSSSSSSSCTTTTYITGRGSNPSIHRFSRRSVWMVWNSLKKQWVVAEGPRDPTVQEIVTAKYDVALQHIMSLQEKLQQQQQQQLLQGLKKVDTDEPVILQQDLKEMASPPVVDPFSASFFNSNDELLGVPTKIFHFLDSKDLAQCRAVSKDWYDWGLQVLMDPSHRKKPLTTNWELIHAVNAYLLRRWDYNLDDDDFDEHWEPVTLVDGERYDPTNDRHFRLFQTQCLYGPVIGKWDVSRVEDFRSIFFHHNGSRFNEPLEWDTGNATNMSDMFSGCEHFNSSLGPSFDTSKVTNMRSMFANCSIFDQDSVSKFNTSNVTDMSDMFLDCLRFNQNVSNFDTSKVTKIRRMFHGCESFNTESYSGFDTSKATDLRYGWLPTD